MTLKVALIWFVASILISVLAGFLSPSKSSQGYVVGGMILVAVIQIIQHLDPPIVMLFIGLCLAVSVGVYRTTIISRFGDRDE